MSQASESLAKRARVNALKMVHSVKASHIGSGFSMADILSVLYADILRVDPRKTDWPERDRFILSKGHATAVLYAVLAESGFFPKDMLTKYNQDGSPLIGHVSTAVPGVELSTGSLGHGLPVACGMAVAAKSDAKENRVFVVLSDGELDEGSNWEAILFAAHHRLDNLVAIVDYNKIQSFGRVQEVMNLEPLVDKWQSFGWRVQEVPGHDHDKLFEAFSKIPLEKGKPNVIIAHTVKGKGVDFMEDKLEWHYKSPDEQQLNDAISQIGLET